VKVSSSSHPNHRLRQERIRRNWRQQELAKLLGTTPLTVSRWERGSQQPSAYFRKKLSALFGKSPEELGLVEEILSAPLIEAAASQTEQASSSPAEPLGLWTVPYLRNPHFTGREDLLVQLAQQFSLENSSDATMTRRPVLSQPQAIKGLGGIGKTQIAVEYAYRAWEQGRYTHIFWINAASQEALLTSFQMLAERLPNFAAQDEQDQHKLIAAVLLWLQTCPEPWLLIFDNADELTLVQSYLPQQGRGSILLTTRTHAVSWFANPIDVEQMGLMEGIQFLLHRTQRLHVSDEERNEAANAVIALDGFPLALDQAGAYIEETECCFQDYLQLYEQHRAILLARRGKQYTNYPDSVATTWSLSFEKIEQAHPAAAELLRLCAFLSPDYIPEELLSDGAAHWPDLLQQAVTDPLRFNELLEALLAFSLVKRFTRERLLSLHRLVQAVQLDRMDLRVQRRWAEQVVRAVNQLFPADPEVEVDTWSQCLRYLEQVQACDRLIQRHHLQLPESADLLDRAGVYLREHGSFYLAEQLFQRGLTIAEQQLGPQHPQVASLLTDLGYLYYKQGKYEQTEPLLQRGLRIREQSLRLEHPHIAYSLTALGLLYSEQGKYAEAEPLYQRAVQIWEQVVGPHHSHVAYPLNNLGSLYYNQGKYAEAEPLYQRAMHIWEQTLGPHHPMIATSLNNLGSLYYNQGKYAEAESLYQRAMHIWEQTLGPHHSQVAYALSNLGELYYNQGKYAEAEPLYQRAMHIWEQTLGPHHPMIAPLLTGLANLSRQQGRYEQASKLYQRALLLLQEQLGPQHIDVAEPLQDLARLRQMQQQPGEALSLYQQALAIREQVLGAEHPKTIETREHLSDVLQALSTT
jgi:tetratricopeptide (TPR) repeat protein/transcriptional regulator with XRE-family HTH domain